MEYFGNLPVPHMSGVREYLSLREIQSVVTLSTLSTRISATVHSLVIPLFYRLYVEAITNFGNDFSSILQKVFY